MPILQWFTVVLMTLIWLPLHAQDTEIEALVNQVSQNNLQMHLDSLCYAGGNYSRITFTDGNYAAAEYIARYFESLPGISYVERDTFNVAVASTPYDTYPLINIIAHLDGNGENPGTYIVGGHYDASASRESNYDFFWPYRQAQGADDNATGVAAAMELARILSDPVSNFHNKDHIKFIAFAAEEYHPEHDGYHHLGSLYDAQKMNQSGTNILGVTILDMIAYNPNYDYIEVITDFNSTWLADSVLVNGPRYVPDLITNDHPLPDVTYSDHDSYQRYGYPAILLMENDAPWNNDLPHYTSNGNYHTTNDKIETVNMSLLKKVTQLGLATAAELTVDRSVTTIFAQTEQTITGNILDIYPNPFNAVSKIRYSLQNPDHIRIRIFDVRGLEIIRLADNFYPAGSYETSWDGKNIRGNEVASGMYLLSLETSHEILTKKLFYVR